MTSDRTTLLRALFDEAVGLEPEALVAFLDQHCDRDPQLRRELETLLAHDADLPEDFLEAPVIDLGAPDVGSVLARRLCQLLKRFDL